MNKYLARLKGESSRTCLGSKPSKPSKPTSQLSAKASFPYGLGFEGFDSALPRRISPETGIPHPRYGHDEFSLIRLPHPALLPRKARL